MKILGSAATVIARALKLTSTPQGGPYGISMIKKEFKPYFDVRQHSDEVVARVFQEERQGVVDLRLRVVHAQRYAKVRLKEDNWEYNRHSGAEKEATQNSFELAEDGFDLIVWISPKSDIYEEGRLNIMLPKATNGELSLDPWGIPLKINEEASMEMANRLLESGGLSMDPIVDLESLRRQPVGFKLDKDKSWLAKCRELIPELADVWDEIGVGGVEKNMGVIAKHVGEAKEIARGDNVAFELEMKKRGFQLNFVGDHGGSWLSTLSNEGIYNYKLQKIRGVIYAEKVRVNGRWVCPICGEEVGEGVTVCPKCKVKLSGVK